MGNDSGTESRLNNTLNSTMMQMASPGQKVKTGMVAYKNIKDRGEPLYLGKTYQDSMGALRAQGHDFKAKVPTL